MMGFHPANFEFPRPFCSRVRLRGADATDGRTDGQSEIWTDTAPHFIMPVPMEVGL